MKIRKIAAIALLVLSSYAATNVAPTKSELEAMYDKAFREFDSNNFAQALKELDGIDARQPDLAESQNLRGVILMRQGRYDEAEAALRKALSMDPKFWNARFNLAEVPFLKKNWSESRNRFEALLADNPADLQNDAAQLIQYKILLTFLLDGKENMVQWIMDKFEISSDTPAVYYANAALALHHKNPKEAQDWMAAAAKSFSPQQTRLFAESFYEVGWMEKPAGESRAAIEITSAAERAARLKADARAKYEQATRAFQQRDFAAAMKLLDESDAAEPNQAASLNLRGEVFLEQKDFDKAEAAFKKAFKADPKFREAQYNLAQIPFKKKEYSKSRDRLEALFGETGASDKNQAAQLIKFNIFMTLLLEGKDPRAQKMMDQFQYTGDTPALYYAQAAWEFKHNNRDKANEWIASARKIYAPALNIVFADSFYDLGWLQKPVEPAAPQPAMLAQAEATPPTEATPGMRFGQGSPMPALVLADNKPAAAPEVKTEAAAPAPAANTTADAQAIAVERPENMSVPAAAMEQAPAVATNSPPAVPPATQPTESLAAAIAAASTTAPVRNTPEPVAVVQAQAPEPSAPADAMTPATASGASNAPAPALAQATAAPIPSQAPAVLAAPEVDSTPATTLAPNNIVGWSQPSWGETLQRVTNSQVLMATFLLAGCLLLLWLVVAQVRRSFGSLAVEGGSPTAASHFPSTAAVSIPTAGVTRRKIRGGPPQLSLQLKGTEAAISHSVYPPPAAPAQRPEAISPKSEEEIKAEPSQASRAEEPGHKIESVAGAAGTDAVPEAAELREPAGADAETLRDKEEVSLAPTMTPAEPSVPESTHKLVEGAASGHSTDEIVTATGGEKALPSDVAETASESLAPVPQSNVAPENSATIEGPSHLEPAIAETTNAPITEDIITADAPILVSSSPEAPVPSTLENEAPAEAKAPESIHAEEPVLAETTNAPITEDTTLTEKVASARAGEPALPATESLIPSAATPRQELVAEMEPVGQGQPIPHQTPASTNEPVMAELTQPIATSAPTTPDPLDVPSFITKTVSTETPTTQPTPIATMPETIQPAAAPETRPSQPIATGGAPQTAGAIPGGAGSAQTAVQITFSFEIASLQLTPTFKMGALLLKPTSKIVSMRLAPSQQPQPAMNLQVTFEAATVHAGPSGGIGSVRLTPSQQQRPTVLTTPSFEISALQLVTTFEGAPVQLTPTHQQQASVQVTASFQISTVEFTPSFEIASVVLNASSKNVSVQLPGAGPSSVEGAPVFEIGNVQLTGNNEIAVLQLNPTGSARG